MSQSPNQIPTTPPLPGGTMVTDANNALAALLTQYMGHPAPSSPSGGQTWIDDTASPILLLKTWDGAAWVLDGVYDTSAHQFYGPVGGGTASLVAGATVDLGSVNASLITITGGGSITSFGSTAQPGQVKFVRFSGVLTVVSSASLLLPDNVSITTGSLVWLIAVCVSSGNWVVFSHVTPQFASRIYLNANQTGIAGATNTKINYDTVDFDPDGGADVSTNHRIFPQVKGKYYVACGIDATGNGAAGCITVVKVRKNGVDAAAAFLTQVSAGSQENSLVATSILDMNGTSDFIEGFIFMGSLSAGTVTANSSKSNSFLCCVRVAP